MHDPRDATQPPWDITCKGPILTLIRGFADIPLSLLWLPPVMPVEAHRTTARLPVSVSLFLAELTRTQPRISCEVQLVDILPCLVLA